MIRVAQLADVMSVLKAPKVVRETVAFKVTPDSASVFSINSNILDHVVEKNVAINGWSEL